MRQFGQKLIELLLAISKFSTAAIVNPEAIHDTIDDEEAILVRSKVRR